MLNEIKFATRQRLQFIEVMAYYTGMISRSMLARAYGISDPAATKDLKLYNDLAPDNLEYNPSLFGFVPSAQFDEVFADLSPQTILAMFSHNLLSVDNPCGEQPIYGISVETLPLPARLPEKAVLAQIIRAMKAGTQLEVEYHSLSQSNDSGDNRRIIEPHALINTGLRWHIRAYNHNSYDFRDFVLSRFTHAQQLNTEAESSQHYDDEWMEQVELVIEPHPGLNQKQRTALTYDYAMQDGRINLNVRRALAAYLLQQLKVDTTEDHSLNPSAYQLVLANRDEIEAIAGWSFIS
jgi:predicted DNA-binding transcriptional regulator YafY